jgi:chromate transporter
MAFMVWSLPGLVVLTVCGFLIETFIDPKNPPWYLIGLPPAAISLVFVAFYMFAVKLDKLGFALAIISCCVTILISNDEKISSTSSQWAFPLMLACGGLVTFIDSKRSTPYSKYNSPSKGWDKEDEDTLKRIGIPLWVGAIFFVLWIIGLVASIVLVRAVNIDSEYLTIFETMYRIGSIIYGGGQVVLPMLQDEVVPSWMTADQFLQGLGLATSMPGPLFNFSAYLGAVYKGFGGAMVSFIALMLPGNLLIFAVVPFWARMRHNRTFRSILSGLNSTAVGLVGAACVILWESGISTASDAIIFAIALTLHVCFGIAAPFVVIIGGIVGAIMHPDAANIGQRPYCIDQGYKYE